MNNKDFYIQKIGERGKISIWLVSGMKVRENIDREFNNFGQHFDFPCIPEYEFWIDKEGNPNERRFFIDHLLVEWRLMKKGYNYTEAHNFANAKEISERRKSATFKTINHKDKKAEIENIHIRILKELENKITAWLVDGRLVRDIFDIDFTEGGHDLVYSYVPQNEVWIDDDVLTEEKPFVVLHELYERSLMQRGLTYDQAHAYASRVEWGARHDEKKLKEKLAFLGWK